MVDVDSLTMDARMSSVTVHELRDVAVRYKAQTGKPLGVTGELGELLAAAELGLQLCAARQAGYDAVDAGGRRLQIKTRACERGMLASINCEHEFDAVLFVQLCPKTLELRGIYEMDRAAVMKGLARPGSIAREKRNSLAVSWFISNGRRIK